MTWFRVGGAGIPATLKNAMNAVFNKKFGTSGQNYPPKGWPDDVNLMGPLPEKTIVSSPIADFSDGADDVPLKSCEVALPASFDGYSSVDVVQTGKNLLNGEDAVKTANNIRFYYSSGKYYLAGTYTLSISESVLGLYVRNISTSTNIATKYNSNFITFTLTEKTLIGFDLYKVGINQDDNVMLEVGSTASTFEPYSGTTHTASLGRTIYGGQVDIVNGTGKEICGKIVFDGSETRWAEYATGNGYAIPLTGIKRGTWYTSPLALSSPLPKVPNNDNLGVRIGVNNDGIYVVQANTISGVTDLASFKAWLSENPLTIIYPLDTEIDFTFDGQEINTRLGYNAFWADEGDTEVTYRADISLALQAVSSSRGLMMASRPVTQLVGEESDPDQVNELVENDETEQEGEDNAR